MALAEEKNYDVAIVGYGPSGATAANLLGQLGLKVVVLERDPDIFGRARAISIDEEVLRIWQSVGLAEQLQRDMLPNRPLTFVDSTGRPFVRLALTPRGSGHPPQQFIYQPAVDQVLREGVGRFPNVEVLLEHECLRVLTKGDKVELMLADLKTDTFKRLTASYVIAADGGGSAIRGQLGIGYAGRTYAERWVVIDTEMLQPWENHDALRFHCNPARPTVDCPTPLGHHRWEFPALAGEDDRTLLQPEAIWKVLNDQGITEQHVKILRSVIYSHHVRVADRWRAGRVFLAGDAAHAMPPWIGQGMCAGVRDVANLCWKLAAVVRGQASEELLDSYQVERQPHVTEVTRRAVFVGRVITERRQWVAAVRNHVLRTLSRVPGLIRAGQRFYWVPEPHYARGFFATNPHLATGRLIPQPLVVDGECATARLDDIIGGRWTLLYTGQKPPGAQRWEQLGIPSLAVHRATVPPAPGTVVDRTGALNTWLAAHGAAAVVLRPDGFVYGAAQSDEPLPPPPHGLAGCGKAAAAPSTRTGATA
ncbi:bifunctional 3-(3-hydroxy-phenyl)propionate/3-hydroxycinnamic acid hydroxylase MhpA [Mycolicibacterium fluoranthenivorans]|uniref:bifunctional 3-(3-hydroxy-phenyl)propionate/3-hydroxycinnamic acid hydroxylase MhpA n=1 Tax=Mycolicibacterium fluoranthenivorans TaxID=258505 RepID=UPI00141FF784|nr:bifunctional 3-(3-hydroxy-phenyl)propionate/3-hydroxycinnamic acid hydroxylase [Mycolicibacterium fluoranthenivorans]